MGVLGSELEMNTRNNRGQTWRLKVVQLRNDSALKHNLTFQAYNVSNLRGWDPQGLIILVGT